MKNTWYAVSLTLFMAFSLLAYGQPTDIKMLIQSESKQLFSETGRFKETADDIIFSRMEQSKKIIADWFRTRVKSYSGETMHADKLEQAKYTRMALKNEGDNIIVSYVLPNNYFDFRVTTPEVLGVGVGKYRDPSVRISYDIEADFEISQSGTAESVRLANPVWRVKVTGKTGSNLQETSFSKDDLNLLTMNMTTSFTENYYHLNDIQEQLNNYIQSFLKNKDLQNEFSLDENKHLVVKGDLNTNTLVFRHNYSQAGITKRAASTDAKAITEGPKSTGKPTIPNSKSPAGGGMKQNVLNKSNVVPVRKN